MQSSSELKYEDFEVEISLGRGREYPVSVINSPAGEAHETMHFPFDELALENQLLALKNALLQSGGKYRLALTDEEQTVQNFGKELWNALLTGEVRNRYDVSLERANREGKGLRLKLRIQEPKLASLPWEFMYEPRQVEYMGLMRNISIVRYLEIPQPVEPLAVEPPLRILGMAASPTDLHPLDLAREKQRVEEAIKSLQANGLVELTWLQGQTWRDLQEAMQTGVWHIFYFIGHGGFDSNIDEGLIALADEEGKTQRFRATHLGRMLADHRSLRLVILNSCEGAKGSEHNIFSGTASILVQRGIPAVLAMQYEITDRAAIEFSRSFYKALANGLPVDAAVTEARKAVSFAIENTIEWGTPVLYMRSHDGVLFNVQQKSKDKEKADRSKQKKHKEREAKESSVREEEERGAREGERPEKEPRDIELREKETKEAQLQAEKAEQLEKERREKEERSAEISSSYSKGIEALGAQDWQTAIKHFNDILTMDAGYKDASAKLKEAEQQLDLAKEKEEQHKIKKPVSIAKIAIIIIAVIAIAIIALPHYFPTPTPVLTTIKVSPATASVVAGGTQTFTTVTLDQFSNSIAATVTWSSSNTAVGTIDSAGRFTAKAAGTTTITASSGSVSDTATVTVTSLVPTTIKVSPATASVVAGGTQTFTTVTLDQFSNSIAATVTWSSSNTAVGTIDSAGRFTAKAAGTTTITASSGSVSDTATVTVTPLVPTTIKVSPATASVVVGGTQTFTTVTNPITATVTWSSSNTAVGTIDSTGKFTALAAGTTTITASSGSVSDTATVTVAPADQISNFQVSSTSNNEILINVDYSYNTDHGNNVFLGAYALSGGQGTCVVWIWSSQSEPRNWKCNR